MIHYRVHNLSESVCLMMVTNIKEEMRVPFDFDSIIDAEGQAWQDYKFIDGKPEYWAI